MTESAAGYLVIVLAATGALIYTVHRLSRAVQQRVASDSRVREFEENIAELRVDVRNLRQRLLRIEQRGAAHGPNPKQ